MENSFTEQLFITLRNITRMWRDDDDVLFHTNFI